MRLAQADRTAEDDRLVAFHEAAGGEVADLGGGDLGVEGEVELGQGLDLVEVSAVDAGLERAALAAAHLVLQHQLQELEVAELLVVGLLHAQLQRLQHDAQPVAGLGWRRQERPAPETAAAFARVSTTFNRIGDDS